jgi:hypothetical protein
VEFLIVLAVVVVVVVVVSAPLRRAARDGDGDGQAARAQAVAAERRELEAAKEAKYREIRDAELDHRTGKLSEADWRALDGALRAEAAQLLRALDRAGGGEQEVG